MIGVLVFLGIFLTFSCEKKEEVKILKNVNVKELVGIKGCPHCHDMRRELLGPSFYEISKRYAEEDIDELVKSMLQGSSKKWGKFSMPPQKLTKEEAYTIAKWIIELKNKSH